MLYNPSYTCISDIKCVPNLGEYKNCVASFGTAKRKNNKIVRINQKSTQSFIFNAVDDKKVCKKIQK